MIARALGALAAAALAACFNPTFNNTPCGLNGECPSGFTCDPSGGGTGVCRSDGPPTIDAPTDIAEIDTPTDTPIDMALNDTPIDMALNDTPTDTPIDMALSDTPIDTPTDTPTDTPVDAPPVTFSGTISLLENAVLNPGTSGTFFGQGHQASITFISSDTSVVPAPMLEESPGSPLGCKAWSYNPAQAAASVIGLDEGAIQMTATGTTPPTFPACVFSTGVGYTCPHTATQSTGGVIAMGPQAGLATLTDADVTYNNGNTYGRYVRISGAINAGNNGLFPIVAVPAANTIVYGNPAVVAETLPATASHVNLAATGPIPMAPDPGFLADDNQVSFALTPGGGNHFAAFTATNPGTVADDFTLATTELNALNAIPRNGAAFTFTCTTAGCPSGSASATALEIITTDAPVAGMSPFAMPPPVTRRVRIRCMLLNQSAITVPAAYSAFIMTSGATRIQASFARVTLLGGAPSGSLVTTGHAIVGYTTP